MAKFIDRDGKPHTLPQTEAQWMRVVTRAAEQLGWSWMHIGRTGKYVSNGAKGTMGVGWPDLVLAGNGQLLFVEIKLDGEQLSAVQKHVRACLLYAGAEYHIWRPSDFALAMQVLNGG